MNTKLKLTLAVLAGATLGALAIQGLNAQTNPPAYIVVEVDVTDPVKYQEYVNLNTPIVANAGGRFLSRGENQTALDGTPPGRFAIIAFDNMDKANAYRELPAYKAIVRMRDESSKYRSFLVDGIVSGTVGPK
jgi:uncharacterized protein (DUF1330 family)